MGKQTNFGFKQVDPKDKAGLVREVFDSVTENYDLMNDLMSLGAHRLWKRAAVEILALRPGQTIVDIASGSGDLARLITPHILPGGKLIATDINEAMLRRGRDRLCDQGNISALSWAQCNAECMPLADNFADRVCVAFGLRNMTDKLRGLKEMRRIIKPGGKLLILEFSRPKPLLRPLHKAYTFTMLPLLGKLVAGDADSYRYLAESIHMHPDQQKLLDMLAEAGFDGSRSFTNLSGGIVAIHSASKR